MSLETLEYINSITPLEVTAIMKKEQVATLSSAFSCPQIDTNKNSATDKDDQAQEVIDSIDLYGL